MWEDVGGGKELQGYKNHSLADSEKESLSERREVACRDFSQGD